MGIIYLLSNGSGFALDGIAKTGSNNRYIIP